MSANAGIIAECMRRLKANTPKVPIRRSTSPLDRLASDRPPHPLATTSSPATPHTATLSPTRPPAPPLLPPTPQNGHPLLHRALSAGLSGDRRSTRYMLTSVRAL